RHPSRPADPCPPPSCSSWCATASASCVMIRLRRSVRDQTAGSGGRSRPASTPLPFATKGVGWLGTQRGSWSSPAQLRRAGRGSPSPVPVHDRPAVQAPTERPFTVLVGPLADEEEPRQRNP